MTGGTENSLVTTASHLSVDKEELRECLTTRIMQTSRGGSKGTAIKYVNSYNLTGTDVEKKQIQKMLTSWHHNVISHKTTGTDLMGSAPPLQTLPSMWITHCLLLLISKSLKNNTWQHLAESNKRTNCKPSFVCSVDHVLIHGVLYSSEACLNNLLYV